MYFIITAIEKLKAHFGTSDLCKLRQKYIDYILRSWMSVYSHVVVPGSIAAIFSILIEKNGKVFDILIGYNQDLMKPIIDKMFEHFRYYDNEGNMSIDLNDIDNMINLVLKYDYVPDVQDLWPVVHLPEKTCVICRSDLSDKSTNRVCSKQECWSSHQGGSNDILKKFIYYEGLPSNLRVKYLYHLLEVKEEDVLKVKQFLKNNREHFSLDFFGDYYLEEFVKTADTPFELLVLYQLVDGVVYSSLGNTKFLEYCNHLSWKLKSYFRPGHFVSSKEENLDETLERRIRQERIEDAILLSQIESYGEFLEKR